MICAAQASGMSEATIRGNSALLRPRIQCPTVTSSGTCSTKARIASRGVTTPCAAGQKSASVTSTQFWRASSMDLRACPRVPPLGHVGSAARGFMTSTTAACPILRPTSSMPGPELQKAPARSKEESMPRSLPAASRTKRCLQAKSPRAMARSLSAASQSGVLVRTVIASARDAGHRAMPLRSQAPAAIPAAAVEGWPSSDPSTYALAMSFSVIAPRNVPSSTTTAAAEQSPAMSRSATSDKVALPGHTTVPWSPTMLATVAGVDCAAGRRAGHTSMACVAVCSQSMGCQAAAVMHMAIL
mmetsp:Transcript_1145/g.3819  ORF Transcript_1145/g.3819 Transcript_1145/m.3819 type:complete len:300 (-) Transcript_1145:70-969(-)